MQRNPRKEELKHRAKEYLQPDRKGKGYLCPICGSGSGPNGTGITTKDGVHFTCWAGCFTNADIIDIIGQKYGISSYADKLEKAGEILHINMNIYANCKQKPASPPETTLQQAHFFETYFAMTKENLSKTSYYRGLRIETLQRFQIGFDPEWVHPKAPNSQPSPRLIIPTGETSYLARDTRSHLTPEQQRYSKVKVGKAQLFHISALKTAKTPIFLVEGEFDALSILDVGGEAIALGSTSNVFRFLSEAEQHPPCKPLVICMDNDQAGGKAAQQLVEGLQALQIPFFMMDICSPYKDANEAFQANRSEFAQKIAQAEQLEQQQLTQKQEQLKRQSAFYVLDDFLEEIQNRKNTNAISTGFSCLDRILDGGFYAGLYIVGAISSLGKTTFCLQIADQIAKQQQPVLVFSLEMSKYELIAKSISRNTAIQSLSYSDSTQYAKTTRGILTGQKYGEYQRLEQELIQESIKQYAQYAHEIYIYEGMGEIGIEQVRETVQQFVQLTGKTPVIVLDYLQILAPMEIRATDKQNTDKAVLELKRMSRDFNIPIVAISSFNRENYSAPVNLSSFKESGAIEYSSDVLIGLQYEGMDYQEGETDKNREKRIRELMQKNVQLAKQGKPQRIQIKILKNRNGSKDAATLNFYPMFNCFLEDKNKPDYSWAKVESDFL